MITDPNHSVRVLTPLVTILLLGFATAPNPSTLSQRPESAASAEVVATGRATVFGGDRSSARDRALRDALLRAVEQGVGARIEAQTVIADGELIDRRLSSQTSGWVRDYELVDEGLAGNELWVRVRAHLLTSPTESAFRNQIEVPVALVLRATGIQAASTLARARNDLTNSMKSAEMVDSESLDVLLQPAAPAIPPAAAVRALASRAGFGLLVLAALDVRPMSTRIGTIGYAVREEVTRPVAAATGTLSIISGVTGEVIWTKTFDDVRASAASDLETAATRASAALARAMSTALVDKAAVVLRSYNGRIRVRAPEVTTPQQLDSLIAALRSARWVDHIKVLGLNADGAVLQLTTPIQASALVEQLATRREFVVDRFDGRTQELFVRHRPEP